MSLLAIDVVTRPDAEAGRRLYKLSDLPDEDVERIMLNKHREQNGNEVLQPALHRVAAVSLVTGSEAPGAGGFGLETILDDDGEGALLSRISDLVGGEEVKLLVWNGGAFLLPLLRLRSLVTHATSGAFWRHINRRAAGEAYIDVMRLLCGPRRYGNMKLPDIACLLGLPGHTVTSEPVTGHFDGGGSTDGNEGASEMNALSIYLLYQHWRQVSGAISREQLGEVCEEVYSFLSSSTSRLSRQLEDWEYQPQ